MLPLGTSDVPTEVSRYLAELVRRAGAVLGDELVGVYAAGSLALAAYEPGTSDIDVAVVAAGPLGPSSKVALVESLRHESLQCPARGLELVVYSRQIVGSGSPEPGFELELNSGPAMPFRQTLSPHDRSEADGSFWYGLDRSILAGFGLALTGPSADEVFVPVTDEDLVRLLCDAQRWWLDRTDQALRAGLPAAPDAVLGACRARVRFRHGVWLPKVAAGLRLVAEGDPGAAIIEAALAARTGGPGLQAPEAAAFQRRVTVELGGYRAAAWGLRPGGS